HQRCYVTSAVRGVRICRFIKYDDQNSVALERGIGEQRSDIGLEPVVCLRERSVVRVVVHVGNDKREIRQRIVIHVDRKLSKWDEVELFNAAVEHITEVCEGIV